MSGNRVAREARASDRWITPAVVQTAIVVLGCTILGITSWVGYIALQGGDVKPMLTLVAKYGAALGWLVPTIVQLAQGARAARTERNSGQAAAAATHAATILNAATSPAKV